MIDGILVGIVAAIILGIAGVTTGARSLLEILIQLIYLIVLLGGNGGRTVGNLAVRTRTINARTGRPCTYDRAVPRTLVEVVLGHHRHRRHPGHPVAPLGQAEPDPARQGGRNGGAAHRHLAELADRAVLADGPAGGLASVGDAEQCPGRRGQAIH